MKRCCLKSVVFIATLWSLFGLTVLCVCQLGAELGALAISHLEEVTDEGIATMATAKTAAVLLPTTAYILRYHNTQHSSTAQHFGGKLCLE